MTAPLLLTYDSLPPGSEMSATLESDGALCIHAPAGRPSRAVRAEVLVQSILPSLLLASGIFVVGGFAIVRFFMVFLPSRWLMTRVVMGLVLMYSLAFLIVWWARYAMRCEVVRGAYECETNIRATPGAIHITRASDLAIDALDVSFQPTEIQQIEIAKGPLRNDRGVSEILPCLRIATKNGKAYDLLHGRHPRELQWALSMLRRATGTTL